MVRVLAFYSANPSLNPTIVYNFPVKLLLKLKSTPVVDVIKLFLEEIWKFEISSKAKTAKIGRLKSH